MTLVYFIKVPLLKTIFLFKISKWKEEWEFLL